MNPAPDSGKAPEVAEGLLRRRARAFFDRRESEIARSSRPAEAALAAAARIGALRATLARRWPSPAEVDRLFGIRGFAGRRIAASIAALEARNRLVIRRVEGRPLDPFASLVSWSDAKSAHDLPRPAILVTAHVGALYLLAAALAPLKVPRLAIRWSALHTASLYERVASTAGGVELRAALLHDALGTLRAGGLVTTVLDGTHGGAFRVSVLGRGIDFGQGAFTLARLSGAPIVPVAALWRGNRVECRTWPAIADPGEAALWLERFLRMSPEQCSLGLLRQLLFEPAVGDAVQQAPGIELAGGENPAQLRVP